MIYTHPVIEPVDRVVRLLASELAAVGWTCSLHAVARSGRSVYLTIANGSCRYRLRVSDHRSRYYRVSHKAKQVLTTRKGNLPAMLNWIRSRRAPAQAGSSGLVQ